LANTLKAGSKCDFRDGQCGGLDQDPSGLSTLRTSEREGAGTDLRNEQPIDLAFAVTKPGGQPTNALAIDETVGDQSHCAADNICS